MVMDFYSRKAVACQVYNSESGELTADLITDACIREKISKDQITLLLWEMENVALEKCPFLLDHITTSSILKWLMLGHLFDCRGNIRKI